MNFLLYQVEIVNSGAWWQIALRTLLIFFVAWIVQRIGRWAAVRLVRLSRFSSQSRRPSRERQSTLRLLIGSTITFLAYLIALMVSLLQFISPDTLVWVVGLFSAAFGLGARPQISDFLSGVGLLFEDTFSVGEKVAILDMEGVVEKVNLRTTFLRASTGELFVIPNGEIRVVRNFSRGRFSTTNIKVKIETEDLPKALELLQSLGEEALLILPNLIEPWQVLSESGAAGKHTELTLLAHARFGKGADMRPRMLTLVHSRLAEENIPLVD